MRSRSIAVGTAAALISAPPAHAQRADENAVTAAEDAFGTSVGNESVGLYSSNQVRGFSPITAGNVRIEGIYLDRRGMISDRLVAGSTIRVGLAAQGYVFPAPTGIVDYRLRKVGAKPVVSLLAGRFAYGGPALEVDAQLPLAGEAFGIALGASVSRDEYSDGAEGKSFNVAVVPRWRPSPGIELIPFWSMSTLSDEEVAPAFVSAGPFVPPRIPRRRYFGQDWAQKDSRNSNAGLIAKIRLSDRWSIAAGVFQSKLVNEENFYQDYLDLTPEGRMRAEVVADPGQRYASISGEFRLTHAIRDGDRLHAFHAAARARRVTSRYGGAAPPIDLGERALADIIRFGRPAQFAFGEQTRDEVEQVTLGLAYHGIWKDVGELSIGVQRADYSKSVDLPGVDVTTPAEDRPWLYNVALATHLSKDVALYGSYTRGLEETGLAPNNAANRNEALPAIRTRQIDFGVRWSPSPRFRMVLGAFDIRKPYFSTDEANIFTVLGAVRHRGVELSVTANPTDRLSLIAGAVVKDPEVIGEPVETGRVGRRPLGQEKVMARANVDYRVPFVDGLSIDLSLAWTGKRPASRDNLVSVDPYMNIDIGARYKFDLARFPALFRVQLNNATNSYGWRVIGSNTYSFMDKRHVSAYLAIDF
jgi:iron complex outermembrane receptor protein